jgi:group I intron endonuclease
MPTWTIYCHMHIETRRCYVGLTSQTMEQRWKNHICAAKFSKNGRWHFPNAIRKYGKDAFSHQILEICDSLEKANWREEAWIELFETRDPEFGFNLMRGGAHIPHPIRKNPWNDPEYRAKLLPTLDMKATFTPQARAKLRASLDSPESKAKQSASSKALWSDPRFRKRVSDSVRNSDAAKANSAKLSEIAKEKRESQTHKFCAEHGMIPIKDCYGKRKRDGRIHYSCKECTKLVNNRYYAKRVASAS